MPSTVNPLREVWQGIAKARSIEKRKKEEELERVQKKIQAAKQQEGSWWPDWDKWLARKSGKRVPARTPGDGKLAPIEDAPGSYVKVRAPD